MIQALDNAIYSKLAGTVTNARSAIYSPAAPDNATMPYIVWDYTADIDENANPNRSKNDLVFIRAYAATKAAAATIDGQIDGLLHMKPLTVTGYTNFWLARESGYSLVETGPSGRKTYMAGAEYRVRLEST